MESKQWTSLTCKRKPQAADSCLPVEEMGKLRLKEKRWPSEGQRSPKPPDLPPLSKYTQHPTPISHPRGLEKNSVSFVLIGQLFNLPFALIGRHLELSFTSIGCSCLAFVLIDQFSASF